jgi:hypothetical protein
MMLKPPQAVTLILIFTSIPREIKAREGAYADQASTVAADWEAAKNGDEYWKSQAYRFGVNIEDKRCVLLACTFK